MGADWLWEMLGVEKSPPPGASAKFSINGVLTAIKDIAKTVIGQGGIVYENSDTSVVYKIGNVTYKIDKKTGSKSVVSEDNYKTGGVTPASAVAGFDTKTVIMIAGAAVGLVLIARR